MGFWPCDRDDPFTKFVYEHYRANVLAGPSTGVKLLTVLSRPKGDDDERLQKRGSLPTLYDDVTWPEPEVPDLLPDMAGKRSVDVDVKLGAKLTAKLLKAMGLPVPGASADLQLWKGVSECAFEVADVKQSDVEIDLIAGSVADHRLPNNAATEFFFNGHHEMFLITRILTSTDFSVVLKAERGQKVKVDVDAIDELFGKAHVEGSWHWDKEERLSFKQPVPIVFAIAVNRCGVHSDGRLVIGREGKVHAIDREHPEPLHKEVGLLEFSADSSLD